MRVVNISRVVSLLAIVVAMFAGNAASAADYRSMSFSLTPVSITRDSTLRFEYNLAAKASLLVEGAFTGTDEDLMDDEIKETGNSLITKSGEISVMFARYSNATTMSGFYWAMGPGYRQMRATWKRTPDATYSLQGEQYQIVAPDELGKVTSEMTSSGVTGHARAGYRYLGESVPLSIGAYVGLRHFQNKFVDTKENGSYAAAPSTNKERESLADQYTTRLEGGIEVGFAL